ncbi:MAG: fused MFS/spermidine synthase [Bryobacteraceae bacterium]|nr:fused MFS/spermidine synthase [Bryobacteraceae bacterium]
MLLYAVTVFLSAFLLFQVQPLIAKMILPWFGGTAAVWATCLLFFQAALLGGYFYSHFIVNRLSPKRQHLLHTALLVLALAFMPIVPSPWWKPDSPDAPIPRILGLLAATVGLPYFMLSTTGPLIQAWFARSYPGRSPYRLYALSNLGSMLALLTYPPLIEPLMTLSAQTWMWSGSFIVFAGLCSFTGWRALRAVPAAEDDPAGAPPTPAPGLMAKLHWVILAACPSMLLLSLTTHLTTDVAPIPFLWVLPLALYLLTFILCFDAEGWYRRKVFWALSPIALGALSYLVLQGPSNRPGIRTTIAILAAGFFSLVMVFHGELARRKPEPAHLTGYFLMISAGGAAGGLFVALIAPLVFPAMIELPITLGLMTIVLTLMVSRDASLGMGGDLLGWKSIGVLSLCSAVLGYLGSELKTINEDSILVQRNFYGELRVRQHGNVYDMDGYRTLMHGTINHGEQYTHPARRREVSTYYCEDTGFGRLMADRNIAQMQRVGIVGLGTGNLAGYSRLGDFYRFYEINPLVEKIANDYFWYLKNSEGATDVVLGDARLTLEKQPPQNFDILAVDAFSSDAIPVHLLTKEAIELYFRHLKKGGVLVVHISNRFIDLAPVLERAATATGRVAVEVETDDSDDGRCYGTTWIVVADSMTPFETKSFAGLKKMEPNPWLKVWTDDFSNIYKVLK